MIRKMRKGEAPLPRSSPAWRKDARSAAPRSQPANLTAFGLDPFRFCQVIRPVIPRQPVDLAKLEAAKAHKNIMKYYDNL